MNIIRYGGPMSRTRKVGSPIGYSGSAGLTGFVSVWSTTVDGESITIPTQAGTFNAVVDWGDSSPPETITSSTGFVHPYTTAGDHTISITGVFPNIYLYLAADRLKLKKVLNLGTVGWTTFQNSFFGCTNLTEFTVGSTDTSAVTTFRSMFYGCSGLTSLNVSSLDTSLANSTTFMFWGCTGLTSVDVSSWDTALVDNMASMFQNCSGLTSIDVSSFNTSSVANMSQMFTGCNGLTSIVGVEDFDITGLNSTGDLNNFLTVGKMTTAQYDNLLVKWEAQDPFNGMTPSFGASKYTGGGAAATARQDLIDIDGWSISDGGIAP